MKVMATSDTHGRHEEINVPSDVDLFIHCGDHCASFQGTREESWDFLAWTTWGPQFLGIAGNHDSYADMSSCLQNELLVNEWTKYPTGQFMFCMPFTPCIPGTESWWAFGAERGSDTLRELVDEIPEGLDVLVTHGPPYGILDTNSYGQHCGCELLLERVLKVKPKYHVFGHIHESYGVLETPDTTFINCAYAGGGPPAFFELEDH